MIHCYCHRRRSGNTPAIRGEAAAAASDGIPPVPQWDDLMLEDIYEEIVKPNKGSWKGRLINGTNKVKRTGDVMNALLNSLADKGYLTRQQKPTSTSSDPQFISLLLEGSKNSERRICRHETNDGARAIWCEETFGYYPGVSQRELSASLRSKYVKEMITVIIIIL